MNSRWRLDRRAETDAADQPSLEPPDVDRMRSEQIPRKVEEVSTEPEIGGGERPVIGDATVPTESDSPDLETSDTGTAASSGLTLRADRNAWDWVLRRLSREQRETFYEGPNDIHVVGRNASKTEPAKFLVVLVKNKGAPALLPVE